MGLTEGSGDKWNCRHLHALALGIVVAFCLAAVPSLARAQAFGGAFEGMRDSNQPIQIEADRLEVLDGQGIALFNGNVSVVQGSTILKTSRLKVFYRRDGGSDTPGGNVSRIEASGRVAVRSGDQKASADNAVVDMQGQTALLTGNVSVSEGQNIVTGCQLAIDMSTNAAKLTPCETAQPSSSGRVKMLFTPNSQ